MSPPFCSSIVGKLRRLARIIRPETGRTLIVPVDDSLIFGPFGGLQNLETAIRSIADGRPDAILAFHGTLSRFSETLRKTALINNLTGSTIRSQHTRKVEVGSVKLALALGADAIAAHVNVTSRYEREMVRALAKFVREAEEYGMPVVGIMYPRREAKAVDNNYLELKQSNRAKYTDLVCHSVRIAVDLGVDLIKTQFTGDPDTFSRVVEAAHPVPVVIAGGPIVPWDQVLNTAFSAISAGSAGVSFGRNIFHRRDPAQCIHALRAVVQEGKTPHEALSYCTDASTDTFDLPNS